MDAINEATRILGKHFSSISFEMEDCSFTYRPDEFIIHKMKAAKECALITVKEISKGVANQTVVHPHLNNYKYWEEVYQELEKL